MSCDSPTGPINISVKKNMANCEGKCHLNYKYNNTPVIATNKTHYLTLQVTISNTPVIKFSTNSRGGRCNSIGGDYAINDIRIYHPSLHTYKDVHADAELIIHHTNLVGGNDLIICIPISVNAGTQPNATSQLSKIVEFMATVGNKPGEGGNVQGLSLNLNDFIPKKGFYTYVASLPYPPCTSCVEYIVYDVNTASINISKGVFNKLKSIIKAKKIPIQKFTHDLGYAYNKKGATHGSTSDESIWIDCQPTGSAGEIIIEEKKDQMQSEQDFSVKLDKFLKSNVANILFGILIVIILSMIIRYIGKKIFFGGGNSYTSQTSSAGGSRVLNKIISNY